jgi:hypothetical protein
MSIYFEGNGNPKAVGISEARDQFIYALKEMRDEALNDPYLDAYEDSAARDTAVANKIIGGVLGVLDGNSTHFPAMNLLPYVSEEDVTAAKEAGADYFDSGSGDIGQGLQEYWNLVNS